MEATDLSPDLENRLLARNVFSDGMLSNIRQAKNRWFFKHVCIRTISLIGTEYRYAAAS